MAQDLSDFFYDLHPKYICKIMQIRDELYGIFWIVLYVCNSVESPDYLDISFLLSSTDCLDISF